MADLDAMTRDELIELCRQRGQMAIGVMAEYQNTTSKAVDVHTELQAEHAATLAEFDDLKQQHQTILKRLQVAERLVEQQTAENRRLRDFGRFLLKKENTSE